MGAFTIIELVVSMLLSSIVAALLYAGLSILYKRHNAYSSQQHALGELMLLNKSLEQDIRNSQFVLPTESGFNCKSDSSSKVYKFNTDYITREALQAGILATDTFHFRTSNLTIMPETGLDSHENGLVSSVYLSVSSMGQSYMFSYNKAYDPATMLNINLKGEK